VTFLFFAFRGRFALFFAFLFVSRLTCDCLLSFVNP